MTRENEKRIRRPRTVTRQVVRVAYPIMMLVGLNGLAIHIAGAGLSKLWLVAVLGSGIALSFVAERLVPYESSWNASHGDVARVEVCPEGDAREARAGVLMILPVEVRAGGGSGEVVRARSA